MASSPTSFRAQSLAGASDGSEQYQNSITFGGRLKDEIVAMASFKYITCMLSSVAEYLFCS